MEERMFFEYGQEEICYLMKKDKRLAEWIETIGPIQREVIPDLFEALINSIAGQQISSKALQTVWRRMKEYFGGITPDKIEGCPLEYLQSFGLSGRKAGYMKGAAKAVINGELDLVQLRKLSDDEVCRELVRLKGIGIWTAEMLLIFSLQRKDVFSYGDFGIRKGLQNIYHHKEITKERFERYRKRYSPYGSIASLYLWEAAKR